MCAHVLSVKHPESVSIPNEWTSADTSQHRWCDWVQPLCCRCWSSARLMSSVVYTRKRQCNMSRFGGVALVCIDLQRLTRPGNHLMKRQRFLPFGVLRFRVMKYSCGHLVDKTNGASKLWSAQARVEGGPKSRRLRRAHILPAPTCCNGS